MEKKDLIKIENAAIRAAGSRMANMFQPCIPTGPGEHEGHKEARRAFYEGFQEGDVLIRETMPYDHNGRHATGEAEYIGGKWWNIYE